MQINWGDSLPKFVLIFFFIACVINAHGQTTADCANLLVVCGNTTLALNSNGIGQNDFSGVNAFNTPSCGFTESQSLWLKIPIAEDGPFVFTIDPNNGVDDFDFAVYGPNVSCSNLGAPLRCSSTHPPSAGVPAATGLKLTESDVSEGPGALGNGFVRQIDAKAGEEYIILIDNFDQSNSGFKLDWGVTKVTSAPEAIRPNDVTACDPDGDGIALFDLSDVKDEIRNGQLGTIVSLHNNATDALLGLNSISGNLYTNTVNGETLYARVTKNGSRCSSVTNFDLVVLPEPVVDEIFGASSICPSVDGVPYKVTGTSISNYLWLVEGGDLASGQDTDSITVNWGVANDNALIKLLVSNESGCGIDTVFYDVKINKRLEPEIPQGDNVICYAEKDEVQYQVPFVPGSEYNWTTTNGTIIGATDENLITVQWDDNATNGEVYFREFNPGIADCEGFSDTLRVEILNEIIVGNVVKQPLCFGENNGSIQLAVSGGNGNKVVTWNNGATGELLENVRSGTYEYSITDEMGCVITAEIEILEPDLLVVVNVDPIEALCFTSADGTGNATVEGGTGVYSYLWTGPNFSQQTSVNGINGLVRGDYNVEVTDENGCVANLPFTIDSPELLLPDLDALINLPICPGTNDGEIDIDALGGVPDYQFFWELNTNQTGKVATGLIAGDYRLRIVDANGCEATLDLEVTEFVPRVSFPNAFTPNGDNENDEFGAVVGCPLPEYNFKMFNKWGEMIFYTEDQNVMWDGTYKGENAPSGGYSYTVFYRVLVNETIIDESITGMIRLFR
jgi:gliding motility-associated-like protein